MAETKTIGNAQHLERLFPSPTEGFRTFSSFWSSPEKFTQYIEKLNPKSAWHDSAWEHEHGDDGFYGSRSMPLAIELLRDGWKEGIEKVNKLQKIVLAHQPMQPKPNKFGIVGAVPDVARAVSGNPLNMRKFDPKKASRRPIITLVSDMSANCGHSSAEFLNRAAVVCALVDRIEAAGYACEVLSIAYSQSSRIHVKSHIVVKECHQPIDIARLAFGLGHTSMFRRLVFAEWGGDRFCEPLGGGLGYNLHFRLGSDEQKELEERHIYVLPSINSNNFFKTEESSATKGFVFIMQHLRKQKFPVFDYKGIPEEEAKPENELTIPDWDDD